MYCNIIQLGCIDGGPSASIWIIYIIPLLRDTLKTPIITTHALIHPTLYNRTPTIYAYISNHPTFLFKITPLINAWWASLFFHNFINNGIHGPDVDVSIQFFSIP